MMMPNASAKNGKPQSHSILGVACSMRGIGMNR